jgi:hypothetical protein
MADGVAVTYVMSFEVDTCRPFGFNLLFSNWSNGHGREVERALTAMVGQRVNYSEEPTFLIESLRTDLLTINRPLGGVLPWTAVASRQPSITNSRRV